MPGTKKSGKGGVASSPGMQPRKEQQQQQQGLEFMGSTDLDDNDSSHLDRRGRGKSYEGSELDRSGNQRILNRRRVPNEAGGNDAATTSTGGSEMSAASTKSEGEDNEENAIGGNDDMSDGMSSCAVSIESLSQIFEEEPESAKAAVPAVASVTAKARAASPHYSGPFSSVAAATAAAPVIAQQTPSGGASPVGNTGAATVAASKPASKKGASSSWKSDWDREEQHHALTKSLARHRQALHDTYKLRDAGSKVAGSAGTAAKKSSSGAAGVDENCSDYDSDDTAKSEATEKTGVGGPSIVPKEEDDDVCSLETKSLSSNKAAAAGATGAASTAGGTTSSGGSSRIIQPRADVMGARGLMAKHRKKAKAESKGGYYGAGAKGPAGVAAASTTQVGGTKSIDAAQKSQREADRNKNFAFITSSRGGTGEVEGQEKAGRAAPRGLLRRRGHKRRGETLNRCVMAQRICVTMFGISAIVVAITGVLLPDTAPGRTVRSVAAESSNALKVAVSGTEGAETERVNFAAATGRSSVEREKALPSRGEEHNRMRRDEQQEKKRTADAMHAARGQDGTKFMADNSHQQPSDGTSSFSSAASQNYAAQASSQESGGASVTEREGNGRGGGRARLGEDSYALGMAMGGGGFRNLGQLHSGGQYRGLAHPGGPNANVLPQYGGITSPNVLPPLQDFNTKTGSTGEGIYIPREVTRNYADVWDSVTRLDMPLFWKVPRSGGKTVQAVLGKCLGAVQASELGKEMEARFFRGNILKVRTNEDGYKYVNVDTTNAAGLRRAKQLGVSSVETSSPVDVIVSPLFHDATAALDETHRGRVFALFRHPVMRVASTYFSLLDDKDDNSNIDRDEALADKVKAMSSVLEYSRSDLSGENLVVRSLTQDHDGPITAQHIEVAKEVMRRKILVGITEAFEESLVRFERYMGWWDVVADNEETLQCQKETLASSDRRYWRPQVNPGTIEFLAIAEKNWADLELYRYAKTLFQEQASLV